MLSRIRRAVWRELHMCTFELVHREEVHKPIKGWTDVRDGVLDLLRCVDPRCGQREAESILERRVTDAIWWERKGKTPPHEEKWVLDEPETKRVSGSQN